MQLKASYIVHLHSQLLSRENMDGTKTRRTNQAGKINYSIDTGGCYTLSRGCDCQNVMLRRNLSDEDR